MLYSSSPPPNHHHHQQQQQQQPPLNALLNSVHDPIATEPTLEYIPNFSVTPSSPFSPHPTPPFPPLLGQSQELRRAAADLERFGSLPSLRALAADSAAELDLWRSVKQGKRDGDWVVRGCGAEGGEGGGKGVCVGSGAAGAAAARETEASWKAGKFDPFLRRDASAEKLLEGGAGGGSGDLPPLHGPSAPASPPMDSPLSGVFSVATVLEAVDESIDASVHGANGHNSAARGGGSALACAGSGGDDSGGDGGGEMGEKEAAPVADQSVGCGSSSSVAPVVEVAAVRASEEGFDF